MWTSFWADKAGPAGQEVTDMTEDTILPHLTTENPICTEDPTREPAFNTQVVDVNMLTFSFASWIDDTHRF